MVQCEGGGLQDGADNHDAGAEHDHALAAELVGNEDGDNGAEEAAEVVAANGDACRELVSAWGEKTWGVVRRKEGRTLLGGAGARAGGRAAVGVDHGEQVEEVVHGQDAAHDTLVVTKEQKVHTCRNGEVVSCKSFFFFFLFSL